MTVDASKRVRRPYLPGPVGRIVRLGLGIGLLQLTASMVGLLFSGFSGWPTDGDVELFIAIGLAAWLTPVVYDLGLDRQIGHGWHLVAVAGAAASAAVGAVVGDATTAASMWMLVWIVITLGWLGTSFVIAALLRTPGCEMRAFQHARSRVTRSRDSFIACPGQLQLVDEWEARATGRAIVYDAG